MHAPVRANTDHRLQRKIRLGAEWTRLLVSAIALIGILASSVPAGATTLASDGRYFVVDGAHPYIVGIDAQELVADPAANGVAQVVALATAGIRKVRIWVYAYFNTGYDVPWLEDPKSGRWDLTKFDDGFWQRMHDFVEACDHYGILVEVSVFAPNGMIPEEWNGQQGWPMAWNEGFNINSYFSSNSLGSFLPNFFDVWDECPNCAQRTILKKRQDALVTKTINTLGNFGNVFFEACNECPLSPPAAIPMHDDPYPDAEPGAGTYYYNPDYVAWHQRQLKALHESGRLVTAHAQQGFKANTYGVENYMNKSYVDVLNFHLYTGDPSEISRLLNPLFGKKVLTNNEGKSFYNTVANSPDYGTLHPEELNRETRFAYGMLLNGGYYSFIWWEARYIPAVGGSRSIAGSSEAGTVSSPEERWANTWAEMGKRIRTLTKVAERGEFWKLAPVDSHHNSYDGLVTDGPTGHAEVSRDDDGESFMIYLWNTNNWGSPGLDPDRPVALTAPAGTYQYEWYDTRGDDPSMLPIKTGAVSGTGTLEVPTPARSKWRPQSGGVLLVKLQGATNLSGALTGAACMIEGSATDADAPGTAVTVELAKVESGGEVVFDSVVAGDACSDMGSVCFSIAAPTELRDGAAHTIRAYGLDLDDTGTPTGVREELSGSPADLVCAPPPPAPTGVSATDGQYPAKVAVSWDSASGATSYEVWKSTTDSLPTATLLASAAASPYDDQSVTLGTTYYYWVRGRNSGGAGPYSASDAGYAGTSCTGDTTGPTLDLVGPATVGVNGTATFTASSNDPDLMRIDFSVDGTFAASVGSPPYSFEWTAPPTTGAHIITAQGLDECQNHGQAVDWTVTVTETDPCNGDTTAPSIALTSPPASPPTITVGTHYPLTATVGADPNGVSAVTFWVKKGSGSFVSVGFVVASGGEATLTWTPSAADTYAVKASVADGCGNGAESGTRTIVVEVGSGCVGDTTGPANVALTQPPGSAPLQAGTAFNWEATASSDTTKVELLDVGASAVLATDPSGPPWSGSATLAGSGSHTLAARAFDGCGNSTTSAGVGVTVNGCSTTGTISSPASGAHLGQEPIALSASIADPSGIENAAFFIDGVEVYRKVFLTPPTSFYLSTTWDATSAALTTHTLTVEVDSVCSSSAVEVASETFDIVDACEFDTDPPASVSITEPAPESYFLPDDFFFIRASASPDTAHVEFYLGSTRLEDDLSPPWEWGGSVHQEGDYTLTAKAYDSCGNSLTSAGVPIHVTLTPPGCPAPFGIFSNPGDGDQVTIGWVLLRANVAHPEGIENVRFYLDDGPNPVAVSPFLDPPAQASVSVWWDATNVAPGPHTLILKVDSTCSGPDPLETDRISVTFSP